VTIPARLMRAGEGNDDCCPSPFSPSPRPPLVPDRETGLPTRCRFWYLTAPKQMRACREGKRPPAPTGYNHETPFSTDLRAGGTGGPGMHRNRPGPAGRGHVESGRPGSARQQWVVSRPKRFSPRFAAGRPEPNAAAACRGRRGKPVARQPKRPRARRGRRAAARGTWDNCPSRRCAAVCAISKRPIPWANGGEFPAAPTIAWRFDQQWAVGGPTSGRWPQQTVCSRNANDRRRQSGVGTSARGPGTGQ
jgi:hypothetical protein